MKKVAVIYYLPTAEQDLKEIFDYIRRDSLIKATKFLTHVDRTIARLSHFPYLGTIPKDGFLKRKGYRLLVIQDHLAFYRVAKNKVIIYRVLHGKRRYKFLL
ncbi:MAG: type II toxin-antitoxin system RelE/ParE family toxin [Deltaproteobacteria bacterium]|nr:type II toxin-antitoxin system RelE/ParE family toxin [Deltaproteobacteria bacterium]